jgi:colicin import membrane protein
MSGVSVVSGSVDLDAITGGGQAFVDRLNDFKAAADAARQAKADLGIAGDAVAARDEASRTLEAAKTEAQAIRDKALADAQAAQESCNSWSQATRDAAAQALMRADAREQEATAKLAAADEAHKAAAKANAEAQDLLAKHQAAAEAVAKAQAALSAL